MWFRDRLISFIFRWFSTDGQCRVHCAAERFDTKQWILLDCEAGLLTAVLNIVYVFSNIIQSLCRSLKPSRVFVYPWTLKDEMRCDSVFLSITLDNLVFSSVGSVLIFQLSFFVYLKKSCYIDVVLHAPGHHASISFVETIDKDNIKSSTSCSANQSKTIGSSALTKPVDMAEGHDDLAKLWQWCIRCIDPLSYLTALHVGG